LATFFKRTLDPPELATEDARSARARDHRARNVPGIDRLALGLENDALVAGLDEPGAGDGGGLFGRLQHVGEREVVAQELVGVDLHLDRAQVAAEHGDLGDTRDREQPKPQRPVGERPQIHERAFLRG
jgi:hypothetical protein